MVPLSVLVALWIYFDHIRWPWSPKISQAAGRRRFYVSLAVLLLTSAAGVYYAFFTCYLPLIAGLAAAIGVRALRPLFIAAVFVAITGIGVLVNISPSLLYWRQHGKNSEVAHRLVEDTEYLSLKIGQLLLPTRQHRLRPLEAGIVV